jgi:hypothetical protein
VCHVSLPSSYRSRRGHIHLPRVLLLVGYRSKIPTPGGPSPTEYKRRASLWVFREEEKDNEWIMWLWWLWALTQIFYQRPQASVCAWWVCPTRVGHQIGSITEWFSRGKVCRCTCMGGGGPTRTGQRSKKSGWKGIRLSIKRGDKNFMSVKTWHKGRVFARVYRIGVKEKWNGIYIENDKITCISIHLDGSDCFHWEWPVYKIIFHKNRRGNKLNQVEVHI